MEKIKNVEFNKDFFGFTCLKDFGKTLFSIDYIHVVIFASLLGGINGFITKYIFESYEAIYTLVALLFFDVATGVMKGIRSGTFTSRRLSRFILILMSYILLLAISFHLAKSTVLFIWLPSTLYFGLTSVLLVSILENLVILKVLPQALLDKIKKKID